MMIAQVDLNAGLQALGAFVQMRDSLKKENRMADTIHVLKELLKKTQCKPGWWFKLIEDDGAQRLVITVPGTDSYHPEHPLTVGHYFPVPVATYNEKTWRRWVFEMCRRVENHELGEWFKVGEERPFAPLHGPGEDPYTVHEFRQEQDAQTVQDGTVHAGKIKVGT